VSPRFQILRRRDDYFKHFSALDIGTEIVKVLTVRREGPEGIVLGVGRERQRDGAMMGGAIADVDAVIEACNKALEGAEDMAGVVPGQVVVGVGGELVKGFSSSISYPRERPDVKVREAELKSLLQLVQRRALREAQQLLELERAYGDLEARLVHSAITAVRMDGYPVISPIGFQGRNLEVTVFNTFAPTSQVGVMETALRELDLELLSTVAQPYALARACATDEIWEQGAIFVDVGGGTTDVALVRGGGVEGTRMFNLGGRSITRRLSVTLGLTMEDAEARKVRHSEGLLAADEEDLVRRVVVADVDVLLQGLNLCLKELARGEALPANLFVCGGATLLPELMMFIGRGDWVEGLPFPRQPYVRQLMPDDVQGVTDATGQLASPQDVTPVALANHALRAEVEERDAVHTVMRGVLGELKV
jgi:cell division protein FtsA